MKLPLIITKIIVLCAVLLSPLPAQAMPWTNDLVADSLIKNSDAVVLSDVQAFIINDEDDVVLTRKLRIRINNRHGARYSSRIQLDESEFVELDNIKAALYNLNGSRIKELDDDDIEEIAASPGYVLYSGKKYRIFSQQSSQYPYIFEYSYEKDFSTLFFWPSWSPERNIPVLASSYKVINKSKLHFNIYPYHWDIQPQKSVVQKDSVYLWQAENLIPHKDEPYMAPEDHGWKTIHFVPDKFEIAGYSGDYKSWADFGLWYKDLSRGSYLLSPDFIKKIQGMLTPEMTVRKKVAVLYKFLQDYTRYVALELGINGWQPHSAESVVENKYGDCKDLSTLMVSMLNTVRIKAYPALALTRDNGLVDPMRPANQFNHCITCVPMGADTIWLECTSDHVRAGEMPQSIENINALVITQDGGKLVRTPQKSYLQNQRSSVFRGQMNGERKFLFDGVLTFEGNYKYDVNYYLDYLIKRQEVELINYLFSGVKTNPDIGKYDVKAGNKAGQPTQITLVGTLGGMARKIGRHIILDPYIFNKVTEDDVPDSTKRTYDFFFKFPHMLDDSLVVRIPPGYRMNSAPNGKKIETDFALYDFHFALQGNILRLSRRFAIKKNVIPRARFKEVAAFFRQVYNEDAKHFMFVKG